MDTITRDVAMDGDLVIISRGCDGPGKIWKGLVLFA